MKCGSVASRELDVNVKSFQQSVSKGASPYTRKKRFCHKILGALLGRVGHKLNPKLIRHIKSSGAETPEEFVVAISTFETNSRRPYIHVAQYWHACGGALPTLPPKEERFLERMFDGIFFAWARLGIRGPQFPYTTLLQLLVHHFKLGASSRHLVRFSRVLRCPKRRLRYNMLFEKCVRYVANHGERF
jgi:hypothetical protein